LHQLEEVEENDTAKATDKLLAAGQPHPP